MEGGIAFALAYVVLASASFVLLGAGSESTVGMRALILPMIAMRAGVFALLAALPFGLGAWIAARLRGGSALRAGPCALAGACFFGLSLAVDLSDDRQTVFVGDLGALLLVPALLGLAAALLPGARGGPAKR